MAKKESKIQKVKKTTSEVESLCALVLRRLQEKASDDIAGAEATIKIRDLNEIFGEALEQFSR